MTRRFAIIAALAPALAGGCTFYTDSINGEPNARIVKQTSGPHFLGDEIELSAAASEDPNDGAGALTARWTAVACNDSGGVDCPFEVDIGEGAIVSPYHLEILSKRTVRVTLAVSDDRGASDSADLVVEVQNRQPVVELQLQGLEAGAAYPVGTDIDILAAVVDPDGDEVTLEWELFPPDDSVDENIGWQPNPDLGVPAYRLTPDVAGLWSVRVVATDVDGGVGAAEIPVLVGEDAPPCITAIEPAIPGATYVVGVDEPARLFSVLAVSDQLDPFPPPVDPSEIIGAATFRWSIASPDTGGLFVELTGQQGADYLVDPAGFAAGDQLSIRVEAADRVDRTLPCADTAATCSIDGDGCLQRITWGVELR